MTSTAGNQPRIFILLPVHNRQATTRLFIDSLAAQTYANWQLVLIDDGSSDNTEAMVLIINDDTEFGPDFLANAVKALAPRSLLLAQLYNQAGEFVEAGVRWNWGKFDWAGVKQGEGGINCFSTRGLFLWARDFREIGGFHPTLLPHYLSDYEFTMRAHRKGFALTSSPDVFVRYNEGLTGIRSLDKESIGQRIRKGLSVKSTDNPIYWTSFILLACPWRHAPRNISIVWKRFLAPIINQVRADRVARRVAR